MVGWSASTMPYLLNNDLSGDVLPAGWPARVAISDTN